MKPNFQLKKTTLGTIVVPVSGGKDSQVCLSMAVKRHGAQRVVAVHNYTGIDHPLTYAHLEWMSQFYGLPIHFTRNPNYRDIWELMDKKNLIPGNLQRFCTDELKIQAFNHWLDGRDDRQGMMVHMGMRAHEGVKRSQKYGGLAASDVFSLRDLNPTKVRARFKTVMVQLPIVDKTTSWVFDYLRKAGELINPLYARGHKRVGCYPCLLAGINDYKLAKRDPVGKETIIKLRDFKELLIVAKDIRDPTVVLKHDLDKLLDDIDADPFGFNEDEEGAGCQWCNI